MKSRSFNLIKAWNNSVNFIPKMGCTLVILLIKKDAYLVLRLFFFDAVIVLWSSLNMFLLLTVGK